MASVLQWFRLKLGVKKWNAWRLENPWRLIDLKGAWLRGANLMGVNLKKAYLLKANFKGASLEGANLEGASLEGANLERVNLKGVNLKEANLCDCNLENVDARFTVLMGATLTGACIHDWATGSATKLDDVVCDHIFLKREGYEFTERRPHSRSFAPGEFVDLYFVSLETVDIIFQGSIDWQAFLASFQQAQAEAQTDKLVI